MTFARLARGVQVSRSKTISAWGLALSASTSVAAPASPVELAERMTNVRTCPQGAGLMGMSIELGDLRFGMAAGQMLEFGICSESSWERAAEAYAQAHRDMVRAALPRLISVYAKDQRDVASALWWAHQRLHWLPAQCVVGPARDDADVEPFTAKLASWPASQTLACLYAVAAVARIEVTLERSIVAIPKQVSVPVRLRFKPGEGRLEWLRTDTGESTWSSMDGRSGVSGDEFLVALRQLGLRVVSELPRPARPDLSGDVVVDFSLRSDTFRPQPVSKPEASEFRPPKIRDIAVIR
jgi:hypothetical protein